VEKGDYAFIDEIVSPRYEFDGKDRDAFLSLAESTLKRFAPMRIIVLKEEIKMEGEERAVVHISVIISPKGKSQLPGTVRASWELYLQKEYLEWRVRGLKLVG
jgi:hypothetical protein